MSKSIRRKKIDRASLDYAYYRYDNDPLFKITCDKFYNLITHTQQIKDTDIIDIAIFVLDRCLEESISKEKGENH